MLDHVHVSSASLRIAEFRVLGGAMARVAAGATPQTVSPNSPSHGNLLNIVTFNLEIKAGTNEIVLDLVSPSPNGDSVAMIGATANYACEP
jgi:hypothetical protein